MAGAPLAGEQTPLPGLAVVLEPPAFAALLERHLRAHDPSIAVGHVRVLDVQHTADRAAVLARVSLRSRDARRTGRQQLFVRVVPPGEGTPPPPAQVLARYETRRRAASPSESPLPLGALAIDDLGIAVYAFPVDPVLTSLVDVTDPEVMRVALNELWRRRGVKVRRVRIETLAYTPEARAALSYEVLSESRDNGLPEIRHLVGKLQRTKSPATLFAGHWAVWKATFGKVRVAPPVGYLAVPGLSLQEVVRGTRLSDLAERGDFVKSVRQAARGIAAVHALDLPLLAVRDAAKEVRSVGRWVDVLRRIRPLLGRRLDVLEARLVGELTARTRRCAPVHSDFHLANVLADAEGVILIDWDQVAIGDPASDVGRFLGALRVSALRTTGRAEGLAEAGAGFLEAYLATRGEDERQIRLFEACGLVVAAGSPYRLQRDGWEEAAEAMLEEAERLLAASTRRSVATAARETAQAPPEARLGWALDPVFAQALLVPLVREAHGEDLEVYRCRCERLSPEGWRLRLRWRLSGLRGSERWKGFVEGIALSPQARAGLVRRLGALREAVGEAPHALLLPRPLAYLSPLALAALEPPWPKPGGPLELPSPGGAVEAAVGRGLAVVQGVEVDLGRERVVEREVRAAARRIEMLHGQGHAAAAACQRALAAVTGELSAAAPAPVAPTLRGLHLREMERVGDRIGVLAVRDVVAGPRPLAVAALLAELTATVDDEEAARRSATALRTAWLAATGAPAAELRPFEALALVRRAADAALRDPAAGALVERLLTAAAATA